MRLRLLAGDNTRHIRGDPESVRTWVFDLHVDDIDLPMTEQERATADCMRAEIVARGINAPIGLQLLELAFHAIAVERALGPGQFEPSLPVAQRASLLSAKQVKDSAPSGRLDAPIKPRPPEQLRQIGGRAQRYDIALPLTPRTVLPIPGEEFNWCDAAGELRRVRAIAVGHAEGDAAAVVTVEPA